MNIFVHECKNNNKNMLIWSLSVGLVCLGCLLLYSSMQDSMEEMTQGFSNLGSISTAIGLDKVNLATIEGYYAIEIAIMINLGGAMYAAILGAGILAKEEEGHTSEFLYTLPLSRKRVIIEKYLSMIFMLISFQIICVICVLLGFRLEHNIPDFKNFIAYHFACLLLQIEIGSICFLLSSLCKKKPIGASLGLALLLYAVDLMCRVIPAIKNLKWITPFYYSNATDIFSESTLQVNIMVVGIVITLICLISSIIVYEKRDLAA